MKKNWFGNGLEKRNSRWLNTQVKARQAGRPMRRTGEAVIGAHTQVWV